MVQELVLETDFRLINYLDWWLFCTRKGTPEKESLTAGCVGRNKYTTCPQNRMLASASCIGNATLLTHIRLVLETDFRLINYLDWWLFCTRKGIGVENLPCNRPPTTTQKQIVAY
jgi:hypothetical protein